MSPEGARVVPDDVLRALSPTPQDLAHASAVLHEVFSIPRFADTDYLHWFYRENPIGPAIEVTRLEGGACLGHLAGIPQVFERGEETMNFVFPLNIAVSERARGRGLMTQMSRTCFEAAARRYGHGGLVGMPNAASTPGYTGKLGFRLVRPLPVTLCPALWPSLDRVESTWADARYVESAALRELSESFRRGRGTGFAQRWDLPLLSWRLRAPGARYAVHAGREAAVVTTAPRVRGVPVAVVLKTFARAGHGSANEPAEANGVIAAACRFHRAPVAVYAGFSAVTRVRGVPLPDRLRPAPLNLIVRSLCPGDFDEHAFVFEAMEFFDFDAY